MSLPRALLLMLALLQATGMAEAARRQTCAAMCRGDGCDDDCAPGSEAPSCLCHAPSLPGHIASPVVVVTVLATPQASPLFVGDDRIHPNPDPREISHVPRRAV